MRHEWKSALTSWVFWLSAGAAPFILFLLAVGLKFFLHEPVHTQWTDNHSVDNPEYYLDWLVTLNKGSQPVVLTYGVLDLSNEMSQDIRDEIDRNDRYEFLSAVLDMNAHEFETWQEKMQGELVAERDSFLEKIEKLRSLSNREPGLLTIEPLLGLGAHKNLGLSEEVGNFPDEFSAWWSIQHDVVAPSIPAMSTNFFNETNVGATTEAEFQMLLESEEIEGYFVIPENVQSGMTELKFISRNTQLNELVTALVNWYRSVTTSALQKSRFLTSGVSPDELVSGMTRTTITTEQLSSDQITKSERDYSPFFRFGLIYAMVILYSIGMQGLSLSIVEEKSSNLIDQLMSNLHSSELLDGKVWGQSCVYLASLGIWIGLFFVFLNVPWSQNLGAFADIYEFFFRPSVVFHFLLFSLLLYVFYGYAFTAILSSYDNVKNTRRTMGLFIVFLVFPFAVPAIFIPFSWSDLILNGVSLIPFCTPYLMVARSTATLPDWPMYIAIIAVMVFSVGVVRLLSITPFTVGISGDGKRI